MSTEDKITSSRPYPKYGILFQLADVAYKDNISDGQLPEGWKVIAMAKNDKMLNGYFGVAFCNARDRHVVIAHRGTTLTSLGPAWNDISGVLLKGDPPQVASAMTFAEMVKSAVTTVNEEFDTNVLISLTGHSLGGWLAQITTFSMEFLSAPDKNDFILSSIGRDHPHTVVFDSPGIMEKLRKMALMLDKENPQYPAKRTVDPETLDITTVLAAPNIVNTLRQHAGTDVLCVIMEGRQWSDMPSCTVLESHYTENFTSAFENTGEIKQGRTMRVVNWPRRIGRKPVQRYETEPYDPKTCSIFRFTLDERTFLENYRLLRDVGGPAVLQLKALFQNCTGILQTYQINSKNQFTHEDNENLIITVKALLRFKENLNDKLVNLFKKEEIQKEVFTLETERAKKMFVNTNNFAKVSSDVLTYGNYWPKIVTFTENFRSGLSRLFKEAEDSGFNLYLIQYSVLTTLQRNNIFSDTVLPMQGDPVLVSVVNEVNELEDFENKQFPEKIIFVIKYHDKSPETQSKCRGIDPPLWNHLSADYQNELLAGRVIDFQGQEVLLRQFISIDDPQMIVDNLDIIDGNKVKIGRAFVMDDKYCTRESPLAWGENEEDTDGVLLTKCPDDQKTVVISAAPGMGKSALMNQMASEMKKQRPDKWIVLCRLMEFSSDLKSYSGDPCGELLITMAECKNEFEKNELKNRLEKTGGVTVLFDGFDEICPYYKEKVIDIINGIKNLKVDRIVVSTRPERATDLKKKTNAIVCTIKSLSVEENLHILRKYFTDDKRRKYFETAFPRGLTDNVQVLVMCAEIISKKTSTENFHQMQQLDLYDLYEQFVENRFNDYLKCIHMDPAESNAITKAEDEKYELQLISLLAIFGQDWTKVNVKATFNTLQDAMKKIDKRGTSPGFVTIVRSTPIFLHPTFAEYFATQWICDNPPCADKIAVAKQLYYSPYEYKSLRDFINMFATRECPEIRKCIHAIQVDGQQEWPVIDKSTFQKRDILERNILHILPDFLPLHLPKLPDELSDDQRELIQSASRQRDRLLKWTPWMYACARRDWKFAEFLLKNGGDMEDCKELQVNDEQLPLYFLTSYKHVSQALLENVAALRSDEAIRQLVHLRLAVNCEWHEKTKDYLEELDPDSAFGKIVSSVKTPFRRNPSDSFDYTTLGQFVSRIHEMIFEYDDILSKMRSMTAFQIVIALNDEDLMKYFLEFGSVNKEELGSVDEDGNTLLTVSILKGTWNSAKCLMELDGIDLFRCNKRGRIALDYAWDKVIMGDFNLMLTKAAPCIDDQNASNDNIRFTIELRKKMSQIVDKSVEKVWDYPLHLAAKLNRPDLIPKYYAEGRSLEERDLSGRTPLQVAADSLSFDSAKVICSSGIGGSGIGGSGYTALQFRLMEDNSSCFLCVVMSRIAEMIYGKKNDMPLIHLESTSLIEAVRKSNISNVVDYLLRDGHQNEFYKTDRYEMSALDRSIQISFWHCKALDFTTLNERLTENRLQAFMIYCLLLYYKKHGSIRKIVETQTKDCDHNIQSADRRHDHFDSKWNVNWQSVVYIATEWSNLLERRRKHHQKEVSDSDPISELYYPNPFECSLLHLIIVLGDEASFTLSVYLKKYGYSALDAKLQIENMTSLVLAAEGKSYNCFEKLVDLDFELHESVDGITANFKHATDERFKEYLQKRMTDCIRVSLTCEPECCDLVKATKFAIAVDDKILITRCIIEMVAWGMSSLWKDIFNTMEAVDAEESDLSAMMTL